MEAPFLHGQYACSADEKGRLVLPAEIRRQINADVHGTHFMLIVGMNRKVWLYPDRYYLAMVTSSAPELPGIGRIDFDLLAFAMAERVEIDSAGRFALPAQWAKMAELGRELALLGVRDHLELWNAGDWAAYRSELLQRQRSVFRPESRPPGEGSGS
jgi:MraZ protein